jgi:cell division septation protein DedD
MITIRPADHTSDDTSDAPANESPLAQEPDSASTAPLLKTDTGKKPMPLVWLPATLCVGLLIAGVYLGGRILNAHSHATAPVARQSVGAKHVQAKAVQATPSVAQVAPATTVHKNQPIQPEPVAPVKAEARKQAKSEAPKQAKNAAPKQAKAETPKPAKSEVRKQAKVEEPKPTTGEPVPMIAPQNGQRYIQVGALDLERTRRYIGQLRDAKLEPHVAPGPTPEMLRVLIGPFADRDSLATTKSQLDGAGIPNFIREY